MSTKEPFIISCTLVVLPTKNMFLTIAMDEIGKSFTLCVHVTIILDNLTVGVDQFDNCYRQA